MKVRLNLATAPLESNRRFIVAAYTAGTLGILAMLVLSWHAYTAWKSNTAMRAEQAELQADMQTLRAERTDLQTFFNQPDIRNERDLAAFLNVLIQQRAFPWTQVFVDLERSLPIGVRVISIQPRLMDNYLELKLAVGALNDDDANRFVTGLQQSSQFSHVQVLDEARPEKPTESGDHVVLSLVAQYSGS